MGGRINATAPVAAAVALKALCVELRIDSGMASRDTQQRTLATGAGAIELQRVRWVSCRLAVMLT